MLSRHLTALGASVALAFVTFLLCGCTRSAPIARSLDRVEALIEILDGIENEHDAGLATPAIQSWLAGCQEHDLEIAWTESVSGREYVALVEPHDSRSAALRQRLELHLDRVSTDPFLQEFTPAMRKARSLIPPPLTD